MPQYTNLSTTDGVDLSFRQMLGAWRIMCAPSPARANGSEGGVDFVFSGIPVPFFNVALVTDPRVSSDALASCGRRACAWAADKQVPWLFVVTHDTLDADVDAAAVLDGCGLAPAMPLTGMLAAHGETPTVLHATEAGRPVYERMGYSAISNHTLFMEKRFVEEH